MLNLQKIPKSINKVYCKAGKLNRPLYKYVYDERYGCPRRVKNGEVNQRDIIQEYANDVDFKTIGKMLVDSKQNIVDHFRSADGQDFDVLGFPRNIHEYNALHNKLQEKFDAMDPEVKALFNNDLDTFRTAYLKGNLGGTLDTYFASKEEKPAPTTVKEGE